MKKSLILLTALCATPAFAADNELYVTGSVGINYGDTVDGEGNVVNFKGFGNDTGESYTLGLGYQYSENVRFETRYSHKENESDGTKTALTGLGTPSAGTFTDELKSDSLTVDIFYDFANSTKFTPYVKAGVGFSRNSYKADFNVPDLEVAFGSADYPYGKKTSTEFTWNVGAGASYELTSEWAVFTEYQIQSLGEVATKKDSFGDRWVNDSYLIQEINLGLRYSF